MDHALDDAQAEAAVRLGVITPEVLSKAYEQLGEWRRSNRQADLAEAIGGVAGLTPDVLEGIREDAKTHLFEAKDRQTRALFAPSAPAPVADASQPSEPSTDTRSRGPWGLALLALVLVVVFLSMRSVPVDNPPSKQPTRETQAARPSPESRTEPVRKLPGDEVVPKSPSPVGVGLPRYQFRVGDVLRYSFTLSVHAGFSMKMFEKTREQSQRYLVLGQVEWTALRVLEEGAFLLSVRFREVSVEVEVDGLPEKVRSSVLKRIGGIEGELGRTQAFVLLSSRGEMSRLVLPTDLSRDASGQLVAVLLAMQVRLPISSAATWSEEEDDATGRYRASYAWSKRKGQEQHVELDKSLKGYEQVRTATMRGVSPETLARLPQVEIVSSDISGVFDAGSGHLLSVRGLVRTEGRQGREIRIEGATEFGCQLTERRHDAAVAALSPDAIAARMVGYLPVVVGEDPLVVDASGESDERPELNPVSREETLGLLRRCAEVTDREDGKFSPEEYEVIQGLARAFASAPENIEFALELLLDGELGNAFSSVITALSTCGTPEAQAGLVRVGSTEELPEVLRVAAVQHLARAGIPTEESVGALARFSRAPSRSIGSTATLGLGVAAHRLAREDHPDRVASLLEEIHRRIGSAGLDEEERIDLIMALGNARSEGSVRILEAESGHESPRVRGYALRSLGFYPTSTSRVKILTRAISNDPDRKVAGMAAKALARHQSEPIQRFFLREVERSGHRSVRVAGLRYLASRLPTDPAVRAVFEKLASSSEDAGTRRVARELLTK